MNERGGRVLSRLNKTLLICFISGAAVTQADVFLGYTLGLDVPVDKIALSIMFLIAFMLAMAVCHLISRQPVMPAAQLTEILQSDGYSYEFYKVLKSWHSKCVKKGWEKTADITLSELLIDGGRYKEGFDILAKTDPSTLSLDLKQVYFNCALYGAVLCGDEEIADRVYNAGKAVLLSSGNRSAASSLKHTLASYEYMKGRPARAEELFTQSLELAKSGDMRFENHIALAVCYLDTGRLKEAKAAVGEASRYAVDKPKRERLKNIKSLTEEQFAVESEKLIYRQIKKSDD